MLYILNSYVLSFAHCWDPVPPSLESLVVFLKTPWPFEIKDDGKILAV